MYQWVEHERKDGNNQRYDYSEEWKDTPIDSSSFRNASGHSNPPMDIVSQTFGATQVYVGAYRLNDYLRDCMDNWQAIDIKPESVLENVPKQNVVVTNSQTTPSTLVPINQILSTEDR